MSPSLPVVNAGQPATKMFITKADLNATLYPEIQSLIARYSDAIVEMNIATAVSEIETYLALRYNIRAALDKTGTDRHTYLLSLARDMAIYHLYSLQETIPAHRTKRYDQAIAMLELIQDGKSTLPGVDPAPEPDGPVIGGQIGYGSNPPRATLANPLRNNLYGPPIPSNNGYA